MIPKDEYLGFLNTGKDKLNISGLQLWDPGVGNWFTFPPSSVMAPGGYALVLTGVQTGGMLSRVSDGSLAFDAWRGTAVLNNAGDNIHVVDPDSRSFIAAAYGDWKPLDPRDLATWGVANGPTRGLENFPREVRLLGEGEYFGDIVPGDAIQRKLDGGNTFTPTMGETPGGQNICFVAGTLIATGRGEQLIERLRIGDRLRTADGGLARLRWAGARRIAAADLLADPRLWPVLIAAGALGPGCPARPLRLSPKHRVLVRGAVAQQMFGVAEVLVPAVALVRAPGIARPRPPGAVTDLHLICDSHVVLLAEGASAEALYLGAMAQQALPPAALNEIAAQFPGILADVPHPAQPLVSPRKARRLVERHIVNDVPFQPAKAGFLGSQA